MTHDEILRARARALAQPPQHEPEASTLVELLEVRLAQERYAVETRHVTEVFPLKQLTPVPCTPPFVRGIVNVRGRIFPVLDFKSFFDLPAEGLTDLHRIVLVEGHGLAVALLADAVVGVRSIPADTLQPSLPTLTGIRAEYLRGVTAEGIVVLDVDRMLRDPKIVVHEEVDN